MLMPRYHIVWLMTSGSAEYITCPSSRPPVVFHHDQEQKVKIKRSIILCKRLQLSFYKPERIPYMYFLSLIPNSNDFQTTNLRLPDSRPFESCSYTNYTINHITIFFCLPLPIINHKISNHIIFEGLFK